MADSIAGKHFHALLNLQISTEKLLLQLDIPDDICEKYFALRDGTYAAIGINKNDPFALILQPVNSAAQ